MKIEYLGHASFRITASDGTSIITDPYESGYGGGALSYGKIDQPADIVTISHDHGDHNNPAGVPGHPEIVKGAGARKVKGIDINAIATFHDEDQGSKRGPNAVMCFQIDGLNVCHLGDLGHLPSDKQKTAIGQPDVLFIPVGGFYTIDAKTATEVVEGLKPRLVIPMHFKNEKCAFPIGPVDDFLAGKTNVKKAEGSQIEVTKDNLPQSTQIVVLKPAL